ncbi:Glycine cleavage system transcriptional activator [Marinomonas spartinae]|uniref:LysR substrate-binding domain-containing protein n=1 Tax=Marinomonas spartinae TaxID=1792290 RepID=UPI000808ECC0|nr:LysR substrate-binding domain-containing protein [Marinomonas spartinae]SBS38740.1 Glycine cleavage system transcriptional activator [Marinomonas spartinae]
MRHLKAFHIFHVAASSSSYTEAANELCITHGAVSKQIKVLEAYLGQALFYKQGRHVCLTEQGRVLKGFTQQAFQALEQGAATLMPKIDNVLTVSCEPTLTMRWLMPRLAQFHELHPDIEVRLSTAGGPVDFVAQGIDLAIRREDFVMSAPNLKSPLLEECVGPVFSPAYWLSVQETMSQVVYLHSKTRPDAWQDWLAFNGSDKAMFANFSSSPHHTYEHFYFCLQAAADGLGAAIGSYPLVMDDLRRGHLVAPFGFVPSGHCYLALAPQQLTQQAQAFYDWLKTLMEGANEH